MNQINLNNTARKVLGSEEGQDLMAALRKRTIERPTFPASSGDGQAMALMMALREGENNICRWLESLLKHNPEHHLQTQEQPHGSQ